MPFISQVFSHLWLCPSVPHTWSYRHPGHGSSHGQGCHTSAARRALPGASERGPDIWTLAWLRGTGRTPRVLLRTRLLPAQLPCLATPQLPSCTHRVAQGTHLMGSIWRKLVSLVWLDTQRNLVTVTDLVTVSLSQFPAAGTGCPLALGIQEAAEASRGIS